MKILKKVLLVLASLVILILVIALFVNKEYAVQRQITINKPSEEVFSYIKNLKNQDNYNKWIMADPDMRKSFSGTDGNVGFVYAWDGDKSAGKGSQQIKQVKEGEQLDTEITFIKPFEGNAQTQMITQPITLTSTNVSWSMRSRSKYPMNIMNLFMDNLLGNDMEASLTTLKQVLENKQSL